MNATTTIGTAPAKKVAKKCLGCGCEFLAFDSRHTHCRKCWARLCAEREAKAKAAAAQRSASQTKQSLKDELVAEFRNGRRREGAKYSFNGAQVVVVYGGESYTFYELAAEKAFKERRAKDAAEKARAEAEKARAEAEREERIGRQLAKSYAAGRLPPTVTAAKRGVKTIFTVKVLGAPERVYEYTDPDKVEAERQAKRAAELAAKAARKAAEKKGGKQRMHAAA